RLRSVSYLLTPCFLSTFSRHPRSALCPYTTLFRSHFGQRRGRAARDECLPFHSDVRTAIRHAAARVPDRPAHCLRQKAAAVQQSDRKSTRLNSSHVSISYAVFCLK